jgi:transcription elongation factor GreA
MKERVKLTIAGKAKLKEELAELKSKRGEIAERLATAKEFGDLRENAEYSSARSEQGVLETRILEIEDMLQNSEIIRQKKGGNIALGSTITLKSKFGEQKYSIVGAVEADPLDNKLSEVSPLGKQLLGKKIGDIASLSTPAGDVEYTVVSVE